jgi:hypothetical protein
MKKKILLLGILAIASFTAFAQLTVIPKAGLSVSRIKASEDDTGNSRPGFVLGAGLAYSLEGMNLPITIQPELLLAQKGVNTSDEDFESKTSISYLEIPVLIKYHFGADGRFYVNAGPSLSFAMGGKVKYSGDGESGSEKIKFGTEEEDHMKGSDLGFQIGGGILLNKKFIIDLRYGLGLSNIANTEDDSNYTEKNRSLQITVGIPLNLSN